VRVYSRAVVLVLLLATAAVAQSPQAESTLNATSERLFDFGVLETHEPIEIESRELDVVTLEDGGRQLNFRESVHVRQGAARLSCDGLEAWYPPGQREPERLIARGAVEIVQGDRRARCEEAVYLRSAQTLTCGGGAQLLQGCDVVRGREIEFDLANDRVRVRGEASVLIHPKGEAADPACPGGGS
jgi:lipopolysaccharide transport protein LptA